MSVVVNNALHVLLLLLLLLLLRLKLLLHDGKAIRPRADRDQLATRRPHAV